MQSEARKVKVCFVITKGVWGGAQKYVYSLATNLPQNYEPVVITGAGEILKNKLLERGIRVYELPDLQRDISIKKEIKSFFAIFRIILKERPQVLHLNSPKASGMGALAGRILFRKNIIQTVHGFTWNEDRNPLSKMLVSFFSWITIILCHKTIVIAPQEEKDALSLPLVRRNKIYLIRNGVEKIEFLEKNEARDLISSIIRRNPDHESTWIGTISELHKNKGLEYAINAVSKISQPIKFFIIGTGEEKNKLEKIIMEKGLRDKVFLVGFMKNAPEYLKAFDIFTLTSIKEGLPYAILEAGRASLPTIASSVGGIPDIIDNSTNGILVTKGKPGEIVRAIEYMLDNPREAKKFGENLHKKIEEQYSIEHMLQKTFDLYR